MKKLSSKILLIVMAVTLILSLNATVNATAEDMAVLENANGDYLIYLNGHLNDEYSYAITTSADVEENNLNWYTAEDTKGNKVIKVSKDQVGSYLWVKIDDEIIKKAEPINISEVSTEAEINEMKTLTNRIKVDATQTITEETREENVIRTVTQGTLKITDDANAKYSYDVVLLNGENANCQELVNVMNKINSDMDIFESIKLSQEYTNLWNNIITNTEWKEVTNATIAQPVDAENGTQYVVLLKKELKWFHIIFMIAFGLMIASFWEFFEFASDNILGGDTQWVKETGVDDTMGDMLIAFLGSILFCIYYFIEVQVKKDKFMKKLDQVL